jgi:serine/threonine-protein kinase
MPSGIAVGPDGSLYIADTENYRVRVVGPDGTISTLAGSGEPGFSGDGGTAAEARLKPKSVAVGPDGSVYMADTCGRIRRIDP